MDYPDPTGQYKSLMKHFFRRFFDFEAIASPQIDSIEKNALTFQVLALMVMPGWLTCWFMFQKYADYSFRPAIVRDLATLTDKCFLLSLSMILIGLITVFEWDMLFPDRKDYLILTPMPVAIRTVFCSKSVALASFLLVFSVAINLFPAVLFPNAVLQNNGFAYRFLGKTVPVTLIIRYMFSHALTMLLASTFVFLSAISLQGILLTVVPPRLAPAVARFVRFCCLLLLLSALLYMPQISSVDRLISIDSPVTRYYPPIWFVGIYEVLLGSQIAGVSALSGRAVLALVFAGALSIITYAICYRRFLHKSLESASIVSQYSSVPRRAANFMLDRWLLWGSGNKASYHFIGQTVFRSGRHILYIGTYLAVGLAIAGMGLATVIFRNFSLLDNAILSIPLVLSFFLLVGMRVIFAIPVDLDSNWLFRLAPMLNVKSTYSGVRKFLVGAAIVPVYLLSGFFEGYFWSWDIAVLHVCFGVIMSLLLMELLFSQFPKIPFTCSYLPGAARIVVLYPLYFYGFTVFGYWTASFEVWLTMEPQRFFYFYAIAGAIFLMLARRNIKAAGGNIRFEEQSSSAPVYLDLAN